MTRRTSPARYSLPEVPQPDGWKCYTVMVPDDIKHVAAFKGQIKALSSAYAWADDEDHTALLAAEAWKQTFEDICLNPTPCGLLAPYVLCISGSFADDNYGYHEIATPPCSPSWIPGTGWRSCYDGSIPEQVITISREFDATTLVRDYEYTVYSGSLSTLEVTFYNLGAVVYNHTFTNTLGGVATFTDTVNLQADAVLVVLELSTSNSSLYQYITNWKLCYTGAFPMSRLPGFTHVFDFSIDEQGWAAFASGGTTYATYSGGAWHEKLNAAGGSRYRTLAIVIDPHGVELSSISIEYTFTFGAHTVNTGDTDGIYDLPPAVALKSNDYRNLPANPYIWSGSHAFFSNIFVQFICGYNPNTTDPGGSVAITKITVSGPGSDPF